MRAKPPAIALAAVAIALTLLPASVGFAGASRVLLIGPSPSHPIVVRVRQELLLLGLDVEIAPADTDADPAGLASDRGAAAVARVQASPPEILLWVDAEHSGGTAAVTRVSESLSGSPDAGLLALRAVELLRGRLIPVAAPKGEPPAAPASTPSAGAAAPKGGVGTPPSAQTAFRSPPPPATGSSGDRRTGPPPALPPTIWRLHVGPGVVVSPGGVPVAPGLRAGGGFRVHPHVELEGLVFVPLTPATVDASEGHMHLRMLAVGAGASVSLLPPSSPFAVHAGGGMGVVGLFFEGNADGPWLSASGSHWSAMPFLGAGAAYRFTPVLGVRADALASFVLPEAVLVIAGREVASFGIPAVVGSLSLEIHP